MNSNSTEDRAIRVESAGHAFFAASMIWLGVMGLNKGDFVQVWQPVPNWVPAREALAYLCAFISLASGIGLPRPKSSGRSTRCAAPAASHPAAFPG